MLYFRMKSTYGQGIEERTEVNEKQWTILKCQLKELRQFQKDQYVNF